MVKFEKKMVHSVARRYNNTAVWLGQVLVCFLSDRSRNGLAEPIKHLQAFILREEKEEALPSKIRGMLSRLEQVLDAMRASTNGNGQADWARVTATITAIERESEELRLRWGDT